jgi:hypothetical protein
MKWVDLLIILSCILIVNRPKAPSLDKDIYNIRARTRNSYTSHAIENIDYLIYPLNFDLVEDKANHLFMSVNALIKL